MADVDAAVVRQRTTKARFVQPNDEGSDKLNVQVLLDGSWVAGTTDSLSTEDVQVNVGPTQHTVSRTKIRRPVKAERTHQQKQDAHAEVRERKDARERRLSAAAAERAEEAKETDHSVICAHCNEHFLSNQALKLHDKRCKAKLAAAAAATAAPAPALEPVQVQGAAAAGAGAGDQAMDGAVPFDPTKHTPALEGEGLYRFSDELEICDEAREILEKLFRAGVDNKSDRKSAIQMEESLERLPLHMQVGRHDCQAFINVMLNQKSDTNSSIMVRAPTSEECKSVVIRQSDPFREPIRCEYFASCSF